MNSDDAEEIIFDLSSKNLEARIIGEVVQGSNNIKIESMFSHKEVVL